ncbi:uncharacterized protein LOC134512644 isoform X2 [Chroicocephalus ridibundus]|uniref:uncharacterized protein LOC134512644 isoform X2 n=1 Tax=Chroicocephalus ridibundus TaxID=1192867 RepID=UPI002FDC9760
MYHLSCLWLQSGPAVFHPDLIPCSDLDMFAAAVVTLGLISPEQIALLTWMNYYWRLDVSAQNCITSPPIIKILQIKYSSFLYPNGRQDGGTSLLGRRHRQQQPQLGLLLAPARSARPPSLLLLPSLSRTAAALATADGV